MFEPENDIERLLVAAASGTGDHVAFEKALVDATVFIAMLGDFSQVESGTDGRTVLPVATTLNVLSYRKDDIDWIAFFSAPKRVYHATQADHAVAPEAARKLFEQFPGSGFVLNPGSDYGKYFLPDEISRLLAGDFRRDGAVEVPAGTRLLLGMPADYPNELALAIKAALADMPEVSAAYLSLVQIEQQESLLLELVSEADAGMLNQRLIPRIRSAIPSDRLLDVHVVASIESAISADTVEPIFKRKAGFLRRLSS
jgi:hypothetical protein